MPLFYVYTRMFIPPLSFNFFAYPTLAGRQGLLAPLRLHDSVLGFQFSRGASWARGARGERRRYRVGDFCRRGAPTFAPLPESSGGTGCRFSVRFPHRGTKSAATVRPLQSAPYVGHSGKPVVSHELCVSSSFFRGGERRYQVVFLKCSRQELAAERAIVQHQ